MDKAITDTGPVLHLSQTGYIYLLKIFETLIISSYVQKELNEHGVWQRLSNEHINVVKEDVSENEVIEERGNWEKSKLHKTDISVLVLVRRIVDALSLTDDLELRRAIESLGREVIGSVGVLFRGYHEKMFDKEALRNAVTMLFDDSSLYLSSAFRLRILKLAEELEKQ